jgi:iron complex outermembrane receptor protein
MEDHPMRIFARIVFLLFLQAAFLFTGPDLFAQEAQAPARAEQRFEEVEVTATRTERPIEEVPAGVSTVTEEEIKNTKFFGLSEALQGTAGVQSESKNGGYDSRLIIRGAGLKARYGVREIMVLLDGVPLTDPDGMTRLDSVDTDLVERIDIVKGPNSTLYGANAAGGVVNIITKSPFAEVKSVKAGYGSNSTHQEGMVYGTAFGDSAVTGYASYRATDSWRQWNHFRTTQAGIKAGHAFADSSTLEIDYGYTKADIQLPGTLTKDQFYSDASQLTSEAWRNSGRYSDVSSVNLRYRSAAGALVLKPILYYQDWSHYHPVTGLINNGGADVFGMDIQADMKHKIGAMDALLTTGIAGQYDKSAGEKFTYRDVRTLPSGRILYTLSDIRGNLAETETDKVSKWGVYVQESLRPSDRWIIDAGVRYDEVTFKVDNQTSWEYLYSSGTYTAAPSTTNLTKDFSAVTPRIGVVYTATPLVHLYANFATGFQTPQTSEIMTNPDLKSLTAYNYEVGTRVRAPQGHFLDLSVFQIDVTDEIVQTTNPDGETTYSNAGKTEKRGVEVTGAVVPIEGLSIGGAYTYSHFTYVSFTEPVSTRAGTINVDRNGNWLPYIPWHQYMIYTGYRHPSGFRARIETNTWGRYYVDNANSSIYHGYGFITNANIGYEKKNLDVTIDAYNLFDRLYAIEVSKDTSPTAVDKYRPGAPRSFMVRVAYRF